MSGVSNGGRTQSYQALRDSEELHRATLSNISDAVFLADDQGAFRFVCPNVDIIFGYEPEEVHALGVLERLLGEGLFDSDELVANGEIRNVEREVLAKSGEQRTVLIHFKRVAISGGTVLATCRDITELRQAERDLALSRLDLAHAGRLALMGQLLTSMMHEIQQPLTSINLSVSAGLKSLETGHGASDPIRLRNILEHIRGATTMAAEIIQEFRALARKKPLELRAVDMNGVVGDVFRLARPDAIRRGVSLKAELAPALPTIEADRTGMQQVLLDLLVNAMDAMDSTEGERRVTVQTRQRDDAVEVAVRDWGPGVDAEHRARLFDPFFTTKPDGLGLGLAISSSIVEAHGGRMSLDERTRRGAVFRVSLPLQRQALAS